MVNRTVRVVLEGDATSIVRALQQAEGQSDKTAAAIRKVSQESGNVGKGSQTALGGLAQAARVNEQAWTQVGGALVAVGAATTAIGAATLKTGISYNTLQQQTRAALTTLLGDAEAVNAQMAELDEFARNSPFAKDVFIRAQQQLLAFGFEAKEVVPILGAIEDAVASAGGNNQQITELAAIISKVGASGKITAQDLMEFGNRGVDAATIIGSQMGKTGAQIREDITDGALGADQAIEALVAGMDEKFGGAAAGVKNTMVGAADRVKAAFRDIAASFASGLVDPEGGGLLVDGFNALADAMRMFEDLPAPLRNTAIGLGLAGGAASLAVGSFLLLAPRLVETWDALGKMGRAGDIAQGALRKTGTAAKWAAGTAAVGALIFALAQLGDAMLDTEIGAAEVENRLLSINQGATPLPTLFGNLADEMGREEFSTFLEELGDDSFWAGLDSALGGLANNIAGAVGQDIRTDWTKMRDTMAEVDGVLGTMAATSLPQAQQMFMMLAEQTDGSDESLTNLLNALPAYRDALLGAANSAGLAADDTTLLAIAMGEIDPAAEAAAAATEELGYTAEQAGGAMETLAGAAGVLKDEFEAARDAQQEWEEYLREQIGGFVSFSGALDDTIQASKDWAQGQADATDDADDSWEDFYDGQTINMGRWKENLEQQIRDQQEWATNIAILTARGADAVVDELIAMGPEGAAAAAEFVRLQDGELTEWNELLGARTKEGADTIVNTFTEPRLADAMAAVGDTLGRSAMDALGAKLIEGEIEAQTVIDAWELVSQLDADDPLARAVWQTFLGDVTDSEAAVQIAAIDALAQGTLLGLQEDIRDTEEAVTINAKDALAQGVLLGLREDVDDSEDDVKINADDTKGQRVLRDLRDDVDTAEEAMDIGADMGLAQTAIDRWFSFNSGRTISVNAKVGANAGFALGNAANGGLWSGGVRKFDNGGVTDTGAYVPRQSMMGGPQFGKRNIMWGEPETGWEAYISGKPGMEERNRQILAEAAARLGVKNFAGGGFNGTLNVSGTTGGMDDLLHDAVGKWFYSAGGPKMTGSYRDLLALVAPFGVPITSTVRGRGSRTLTGALSKHGQGKAIDTGLNYTLWKYLEGMKGRFAELYGPWGLWRNGVSRWGMPGARTVANSHRDHIHIATYANGGMHLAGLHDGEHVWAKREVDAAGGQDAMYRMRQAVLANGATYDVGGAAGARYGDRATMAGKIATGVPQARQQVVNVNGGGGAGLPEFVTLVDASGALLGRMRVVAEGVQADATRGRVNAHRQFARSS